MTPVAEVNLEVDSWTTICKATTADSSFGFEDNVCEDTLSSQSTYKINSDCPYYCPRPTALSTLLGLACLRKKRSMYF